MKKLLLFILLFLTFQTNYGQESYSINNETLQLKSEINGNLDLLWTSDGGQYRYFVKSENGTITELKNTKDENKNYREEYKKSLSDLTNGAPTDNLKLRLYDLKAFINSYNVTANSAYDSVATSTKVGLRLAFFGGLTNNPFVKNTDNKKVLQIGGELEIFEGKSTPRHSGFIQGRHTFDADEYNYSTNEVALGYRYRIINTSSFSLFGQVKLATLNNANYKFEDEDKVERNRNVTSFNAPITFGIGSDIKVGKNSYITLIYSELFAVFLDNQGNFSTDFVVGYKFNL